MRIVKCAIAVTALLSAVVAILLYVQHLHSTLCQCPAEVPLLEDKSSAPRLVVISLDGFRADYLDENLTPHMFQLATEEGVLGNMLSTFTTKTFPNHHSMATGLYQEKHGIVHNNRHMFDPEMGARFIDLEDGASDRWWDNGLATPIYIANQLADPRRASCCAPWIGCHARYLGGHRAHYHRHFNKTDQWQEQFDWAMQHMTQPSRPANLVLLYVPEPDMTGHESGPFGEATLQKVAEVDQFVEYVRRQMGVLGLEKSTNLMLVSDHGIAEIHPSRVIVLDLLLNSTWYNVFGCSPVLHIKPRPGYELVLARALVNAERQSGHFRVYTKETMPARWHYRHHRRIHDYVLVADEGWSLHPSQAQADIERHNLGQHGYDNLAPSMKPLFIAVGPSFKKGYKHPRRFNNVDLYPLMLRLLGLSPTAHYHEGNLTNVVNMLRP